MKEDKPQVPDWVKAPHWVQNLKIQSHSEHPEVKSAADVLTTAHYKDKARKREESAHRRAARKLIASLWLHEQSIFRFTTHRRYFQGGQQGQRKQVWMTQKTLNLFNAARELGWIVVYREGIAPQLSKSGKGFNTIYRTTESFYWLLTNLKHEDITPDLEAPRIELKSSEDVLLGVPEEYESSDDFSATNTVLKKHYSILEQSNIKLANDQPVPLSHLFYIRKFKHTMNQGVVFMPSLQIIQRRDV